MATSIVGTPQAEGDTSSASTLVMSAASHTAGNGLVLFTIMGASGTVVAGDISNTAGDTWLGLTGTFVDSVAGNRLLGFYVPSTNGNAADVITIPISNGPVVYRAAVVFEVDWDTTGVFDNANAAANNAGSTSPSSGNITLGAASGILCASGIMSLATTFTAGSGFTGDSFAITGDANKYFWWEYKLISGTTAATATLGTSQPWATNGASFKDVAAGVSNGNAFLIM